MTTIVYTLLMHEIVELHYDFRGKKIKKWRSAVEEEEDDEYLFCLLDLRYKSD